MFNDGVKDATEASELNGDDIPPMLRDESTVILLLWVKEWGYVWPPILWPPMNLPPIFLPCIPISLKLTEEIEIESSGGSGRWLLEVEGAFDGMDFEMDDNDSGRILLEEIDQAGKMLLVWMWPSSGICLLTCAWRSHWTWLIMCGGRLLTNVILTIFRLYWFR